MNGSSKPSVWDKKYLSPEERVKLIEEKLQLCDYMKFWLWRTFSVALVVFIMFTTGLVWFFAVKLIWGL